MRKIFCDKFSSQAFNGWEYYKTFEDGGISGGTMKRPGLQKMMEEIKAGKIQLVATYKVDRLSRSIVDFHKMMREFEKHQCSFVSITQAFDTSTSMGKLTLNMLLSFAQFEREVASERIRDKIAASKKKGLWIGNIPPLGYDVKDKKLVINQKEAETVRFIFEKYLELGSLNKLRDFLNQAGIKNKKYITKAGKILGGKTFLLSTLALLLRSQVYIGRIEHKRINASYPGQHKEIISRELFRKVQALLDENRNKENKKYRKDRFLLSGKLFDADGRPFKNQNSSKDKIKKYRYYALRKRYLPAGDVESIVVDLVSQFFDSPPDRILGDSLALDFRSVDYESLTLHQQNRLIRAMIEKIILQTSDRSRLVIQKAVHLNPRHRNNRFVGNGRKLVSVTEIASSLIKALAIGWRYRKMEEGGLSPKKIAKAERKTGRTIYRYLRLNYLSPNIFNDIMDGRVPTHVNLQTLFQIASRYSDFKDQEKVFLKG